MEKVVEFFETFHRMDEERQGMLYYLLYPLYDKFVGFNVVRHITFRR